MISLTKKCYLVLLFPASQSESCAGQSRFRFASSTAILAFSTKRAQPCWSAAALLIRSRKDLLERLRDHAVAGGVHMEVRRTSCHTSTSTHRKCHSDREASWQACHGPGGTHSNCVALNETVTVPSGVRVVCEIKWKTTREPSAPTATTSKGPPAVNCRPGGLL
jgi:hypothetical protein